MTQEAWLGPEAGSLKLNVDAAWEERTGRGAMGCVVRDHRGEVVGVSATLIEGVDSVLTAECRAIHCGLQFLQDRGWRVSSMESDCLRATQLVNSKSLNGVQGPIIADIGALVESQVLSKRCQWVSRSCNEVANSLAKARLDFLVSDFISCNCPAWLRIAVQRDSRALFSG